MQFIFLAVFVFCSNIHPIIFPKTILMQPRTSSMKYITLYDEYNKYDEYDKHTKLLSKEKTNNFITKWLIHAYQSEKSYPENIYDDLHKLMSYLHHNHSNTNYYLGYTENPIYKKREPDYIVCLKVMPQQKQIDIDCICQNPYGDKQAKIIILKKKLKKLCSNTNTILNFDSLKDLKNQRYYLEFLFSNKAI